MMRSVINWKIISLATLISIFPGTGYTEEEIPPYVRSEWKHWIDADKDCENTREEALVRDATLVFWTNDKCTPTMGIWNDWYYDRTIFFSSELDADHIIPLEYAHYAGGWKWSTAKKKEFANDLENITIVSASANRSKGSKGPSDWLPVTPLGRCIYTQTWGKILFKYHLIPADPDNELIEEFNKSACK